MATDGSENRPRIPRSIRHKQILDAAANQPNASLEAIAADIPSATADLVEQVLEEYGDPAASQPKTPPEAGDDDSDVAHETVRPAPEDLSAKQREILKAIHEDPTATQRELAETLDVSGATVSKRANSIAGFTWDDRETFAAAAFDTDRTTAAEDASHMASTDTDYENAIDQLTDRVTTIEQQMTDLNGADDSRSAFADPELTHKVVHACLKSTAITEEEELRILKSILR